MGIFKRLKAMKGNTLYYPGCLIKFGAKELNKNYKKILNDIGVEFIQLKDSEFCCGKPVLNAGHKEEYIKLVEKNFNIFKEHGISRIITPCPSCFNMFSKEYHEILPKWNIEVEHITQTINEAVKKGKINPNKLNKTIVYHDPCHLGRLSNIYEEPRNILKETNSEIKEMKLSKNYSFCCGAGAGVKTNYPELSKAIAKEKIKMAEETGAEIIITTCPMCYMHLKENSDNLKVMELSELFIKGEKNEKA